MQVVVINDNNLLLPFGACQPNEGVLLLHTRLNQLLHQHIIYK
jgi:hypothetical protein